MPPESAQDRLNRPVFVKGGTFQAGSDDWDDAPPDDSPFSKDDEYPRRWEVESFWIQEHEVTNEEYRRFDPEHDFPPELRRHPVVDVTWTEAMAYAVARGGSLPNEVQWEFAARGEERRVYPWGDEPPTCALAHYAGCEPDGTLEVMSRPGDVTPSGVYDLAGNVREWTMPVWFDRERHPVNPDAYRLKGASFTHPEFFVRSAAVTDGIANGWRYRTVGFRVAWEAGGPPR